MLKQFFLFSFFVLSLGLALAKGQYPFEEKGRYGLKDESGKILIPPVYEGLGWSDSPFSQIEGIIGYKEKGHWGLMRLSHERVTPPRYLALNPTEGGMIVASKKQEYTVKHLIGLIDISGKEIVSFQYDGLKVISLQALVFIKSGTQYLHGLVSLENKTLIPPAFKKIEPLGNLRYAVENMEGKTALYNDQGLPVTPFILDALFPFEKDLAIFMQDRKMGLMDRNGTIVAGAQYKEIKVDEKGKAIGLPILEWNVLNGQNQVLYKIQADSIISLGQHLFKVCLGGKAMLANTQFQPLTQPLFDDLGPFAEGHSIFKSGTSMGMLRADGTVALEGNYSALIPSSGFILGMLRHQGVPFWSLMDGKGKQLTTKHYQWIGPFNGSFFPVRYRNYYGGINAEGKETIACVYDSLLQHKGEQIAVKFRGHYGIISTKEEWLAPPQPQKLALLNDTRYLAFQGNTTYLKTFDGTVLYFTNNPLTERPGLLEETVSDGGKWSIDMEGRIVSRQLPPELPFEQLFGTTEGLRGIKRDGRYGFVDDQGRLRIANRYEDIQPYQETFAAVKIRGKWGFIDHAENLVIQPNYDKVSNFQHGISIVRQKGLCGLIDVTGKLLLPPRYENIERLPNKRFLLSLQQGQGLADINGELLFPPKFNAITDLNNGYVLVERDGLFGLLTTQGVSTIPLQYNHLIPQLENEWYLAVKTPTWVPLN